MSRIGIILGSTRPNRNGEQVARWVLEIASRRRDACFELLDLRDYPLPHLDEPLPPSFGDYQNEHTRQWAAKIASFDGFVIVTPEYNHGTSGVLKNALDYLYAEWNNKAVGFVSYGGAGGTRAVEHLRLVAGELQMADVRQQVVLSLMTEFENFSVFTPGDYNLPALTPCWTRSLPGARRSHRYATLLPPQPSQAAAGRRADGQRAEGRIGGAERRARGASRCGPTQVPSSDLRWTSRGPGVDVAATRPPRGARAGPPGAGRGQFAAGLRVPAPSTPEVRGGRPGTAARQPGLAASMNSEVNRCTHRYTLTWSTVTPRSASSSPASR